MHLHSNNTNTLQNIAYRALLNHGILRPSRNGQTLMIPDPVTISLTSPWQRVNFCAVRDANPFFHLWEGLAMLGGVNSVKLMSFFAKNMLSYTDNGLKYNAFYGERARRTWGDQVDLVIKELKAKPDSRQCVVNLWDPTDLLRTTKDRACNLCLIFSVDHLGALQMTTYNRSNDVIFGGVTGANIVHLSMFQEYVALALGLRMGKWHHVANNFHVYVDNPKWIPLSNKATLDQGASDLEWSMRYPEHFPLFQNRETFDVELDGLLDEASAAVRSGDCLLTIYTEPFLEHTAKTMFNAWVLHKGGYTHDAIETARDIHAEDWSEACVSWFQRRQDNSL